MNYDYNLIVKFKSERFTIVSDSNKKQYLRTYDLVVEAIGAAFIAVGAFISLNIAQVPFTLQTLAIFAVLMTIGGKRGTISIICYLLLGAVGLPVFSGFKGGFASIIGPTGGFLLGFILVGFIYLLLADVLFKANDFPRGKRIVYKAIIAVICHLVLYVFGVLWFVTVYASQTGPIGFSAAISMCVLPFILPDAAKIAAAILVSEACHGVIKK